METSTKMEKVYVRKRNTRVRTGNVEENGERLYGKILLR